MNFNRVTATDGDRELLAGFPTDDAWLDLVTSLASSIADSVEETVLEEVLVISISGSQGTGKSTLVEAVHHLLEDRGIDAAVISLDDFYLTRSERQHLSREVHPLLATRGVPGTHDYRRLETAIDALKAGEPVSLPMFNKAQDDRSSETRFLDRADVILCEGWCWGAVPEPLDRLEAPVNHLEADSDETGAWRQFVNESQAQYQKLFQSDFHLFLKVPSMDSVFDWRWQQESELIARQGDGSRAMTKDQVREFIQYYERVTRWMLEEMPSRSDLVVSLDSNHNICAVEGLIDSGSIQ